MSRVAAAASEAPCAVMMSTDDHNCFLFVRMLCDSCKSRRRLAIPRPMLGNSSSDRRTRPTTFRERGRLSSRDSIKYLVECLVR
jgi:hypothetical protein